MASAIGRDLARAPGRYTLSQALRLLGVLHGSTAEACSAYIRDRVAIRSWLSLAFPPGEMHALERREGSPEYLLTETAFGLYSTLGPLPTFYTEELLDEMRRDESVSRDFLDILNNHLNHLMYAAGGHNSLARRTVESGNRDAADVQYSLAGQGLGAFREPFLPKAAITEILACRSRSASSLERYLCLLLGRGDVTVEQCVERRVPVPVRQRCLLGSANAVLGDNAVLGAEVRDSTGMFRVHLNRVRPGEMREFLHGGRGLAILEEQIRRFLDISLDYDLVLHPDLREGVRTDFPQSAGLPLVVQPARGAEKPAVSASSPVSSPASRPVSSPASRPDRAVNLRELFAQESGTDAASKETPKGAPPGKGVPVAASVPSAVSGSGNGLAIPVGAQALGINTAIGFYLGCPASYPPVTVFRAPAARQAVPGRSDRTVLHPSRGGAA